MRESAVPVDLTNCDREPIHIPGAIQPHGVLLSLGTPPLSITQVSANVEALLQLRVDQVLGWPLSEVVDPNSAEAIRTALAEDTWSEQNPLHVEVRGESFDGIVHRHDGAMILELEPAIAPANEPATRRWLRRALEDVQHAETLAGLCQRVVGAVRRLTGFERVMLYRFDEDGNGSVDAEDKPPSLEPYLGLHYPASDIPQQARELYRKNWLRIIPDARYTPVPLVPLLRPDTSAPLDLAMSVLRSVSPIHVEYLANMGIRASMSVSLIVRDRLWGLISCAHHSGPMQVPYDLRSACEVLGRVVSLQIAALADREAATLRTARRGTHEVLAAAMATSDTGTSVLAGLIARADELMHLVGAEGAAVESAGEVVTCGRTPPLASIRSIASWLEDRGELHPFATASLSTHLPATKADKDVASGLLTFALPGTPRRRLLWFRPEIIQTVSWGGDPHKPVEPDRGMRLHPRRSFEEWKEKVRLRSQPWSAANIEAADELRRIALELDLERQLIREQNAVRARDDLVAVVSHDLKNPLSVIRLQAGVILLTDRTEGAGAPSQARTSAEAIQRAADRMTTLIHDLLDLSRIEARRFAVQLAREEVRELVEHTLFILRPLAEAKHITIITELRDTRAVSADRERMYQVLANLIGNAIKFTPPHGMITIRTEPRGSEVVFTVADTGPGISPEQVPHVFDRYWQADRGRGEGSGLGLFIAQGIVEAHGGRIWVEPARERGAIFGFTLPVARDRHGELA